MNDPLGPPAEWLMAPVADHPLLGAPDVPPRFPDALSVVAQPPPVRPDPTFAAPLSRPDPAGPTLAGLTPDRPGSTRSVPARAPGAGRQRPPDPAGARYQRPAWPPAPGHRVPARPTTWPQRTTGPAGVGAVEGAAGRPIGTGHDGATRYGGAPPARVASAPPPARGRATAGFPVGAVVGVVVIATLLLMICSAGLAGSM